MLQRVFYDEFSELVVHLLVLRILGYGYFVERVGACVEHKRPCAVYAARLGVVQVFLETRLVARRVWVGLAVLELAEDR